MTAQQLRAADPGRSVWVAASAGTGKTKVLADRVLRLMLGGTAPQHILCLTFTKAAAAEMAVRVNRILAEWAIAGEGELSKVLADLTGETPEAGRVDAARRLFARVLDAPGGIRIQTIHSFCQSLLGRFPLEAGVPPHFQVMDERTSAEMLRAALESLYAEARAGDQALAGAFGTVTAHLSEEGFAELAGKLTAERARLRRALSLAGGSDGAVAALRGRLGVGPEDTEGEILAAAVAEDALDGKALRQAAEALDSGTESDISRAVVLRNWLAAGHEERVTGFAGYRALYFTQAGDVRKRLATKGALDAWPEVVDTLGVEATRLGAVGERLKALVVAEATGALLRLGSALLDHYAREKAARARLDYDDLILSARELLTRPGVAPWVLFKLDGGIDHILVDEAQDTNPEQWEVIGALAEEFFAGEGAREVARTVFAVGDTKQSIFSFQRADPDAFAAMREHFAARAEGAGRPLVPVALEVSFRSTGAVLAAVDAVFARDAARAGVALDGRPIRHHAHRAGQAGLVEVWPAAEPRDADDPPPWTLPVAARPGDSPRARLARLIAGRIHAWTRLDATAPGAWLESRGRQVHPGDVMVLVRRRSAFVEELVRELKERGVPVAGVDRMVLGDQIAVMDLVALGAFLLLPEDDLTLATVLKSPFLGLDEDRLFSLAHDREGTLWRELGRRRGEEPAFAHAHDWLAGLRARVDFTRPYELFAEVLTRGGRRRLLGRLGPDAAEPIDEFLALALEYERSGPPSLQGFLHWLAAGRSEVKRELDQGRGTVRIMTVHGAKGLQAPIVFLPDTLQAPRQEEALLWPGDTVIWPPRRAHEEAVSAAARVEARARRDAEYRRLLYVAMTRAEDRLYVCGWHISKTPPEGCWYDLVRDGLDGTAEAVGFDFTGEIEGGWAGHGLRLAGAQTADAEDERHPPPVAPAGAALPAWAVAPPAAEPAPSRPLAPSRPETDEPAVTSPLAGDDGARFRRGIITHQLLEMLPDQAPEARAEACRRYLSRAALGLEAAECEDIAAETLAVLAEPAFAPLFGPGSRAEVPVTGAIGDVVISGQIDRLLVTSDAVTILDYKTNRPPPAEPGQVGAHYLRQMAAYRSLLREIYPDRPVRCALLWTDGPHLMALPDALLDPHAP